MPVNFQSIQIQIRQMGQESVLQQREQKDKLALARGKLHEYATDLDLLCRRVEQAAALNNNLRCAVPTDESLTSQITVPPLKCPYVLLAADGSQVTPSHHDAVIFGVINVGAIRVLPGESYAPVEIIDSSLLFQDALYNAEGYLITEEIIALTRDIAERRLLAEYATREKLPVVTLTDGQLEIYGESRKSAEFDARLEEYRDVLQTLASKQVVTSGYVEKPASDMVVRLLDLMMVDESELKNASIKRQLRGISDRLLFSTLLGPYQRSAIFSIQSKHQHLTGKLAVHFFYLNVSHTGYANIARVEIPAWVADDPALVDLLHFALVEQCRQMGSRPYPYALHRAHEVAVVSLEEKRQLQNMILLELRRQGVDVEDISNKQYAKELQGRTRYS